MMQKMNIIIFDISSV